MRIYMKAKLRNLRSWMSPQPIAPQQDVRDLMEFLYVCRPFLLLFPQLRGKLFLTVAYAKASRPIERKSYERDSSC